MRAFIAAALLLATMAPGAALADAAVPTRIQVAGTGTVTLAPDVAIVSASVQTNSANASDAVGRNNAIYERVAAALAQLGIERADVTLAGYSVNYFPKPEKPAPDTVYGYTVSRDFTVKVRAIAKAGNVVDAVTRAGATSIGGVSFGLSDPAAAQASATAKAVDDARAKAEALAAAAHLRITGIRSIDLGGGSGPVMPMAKMMMSAAPEPATQFDTSSVGVTVTVQITFLAAP